MPKDRPLRVLWIAEAANPKLTSVALIGWSCTKALSGIIDGEIVSEERNRQDILEAGGDEKRFKFINSRAIQGAAWKISKFLRGGTELGWTIHSAMMTLAYPYFERQVWKQYEARLRAGEFDLVHRVTPLSPITSSFLAPKLAKIGVPFILGPLNGGIGWPKPFAHLQAQEGDRLGKLRGLAKLLPGHGRTQQYASTIIAASRSTYEEIPSKWRNKTVFLPENAIDVERFPMTPKQERKPGPLRLVFVGRLVPYKGADILLEAAAPLVREGKAVVDIIGDGPQKEKLKQMAEADGITSGVKLDGWVKHEVLAKQLAENDLFVFPSAREFGGGVVLEAMALGLPAVVLDHGGPAELIPEGLGHKISIESREQVIADVRKTIERYVEDPSTLHAMGLRCQEHISRYFTWESRARQLQEVYQWTLDLTKKKPHWGMPIGQN